jgi:hypothetical protein
MAVTRANVEGVLVDRQGSLMTFTGKDGATVDGTNGDLNDSIGYGIRKAGYTVDDISAVDDVDVARVSDDDLDKMLDLSEFRLIESILGNLDEVDLKLGQRSESFSQLATRIEKTLDRKKKSIMDEYGIGLQELEAGRLTLDFADHLDDTSI